MHSSAVCNLFSKRWSGSMCEHLGGKAGFGDILKYIVSSASSMKQLQKGEKTVNKNMSWLYFFHIDIQLWWISHRRWITADLECQIQPTDVHKVGSQKVAQERWTQQEVYVSIKYRPCIKLQKNWTGFLLYFLLWTWLCFYSTKGCFHFSSVVLE